MLTWLPTFVRHIRAGRRRTRQWADPLLSSDAERAHARALLLTTTTGSAILPCSRSQGVGHRALIDPRLTLALLAAPPSRV
jgi:hypothetical protein